MAADFNWTSHRYLAVTDAQASEVDILLGCGRWNFPKPGDLRGALQPDRGCGGRFQ